MAENRQFFRRSNFAKLTERSTVDNSVNNDQRSQRQKFEAAARELETDEDEARWDERLRKVAGQKPAPEKSK
jgi:hypothetical protein